MNKTEENKSKILVYGIDRVGYTVPKENIETKLCVLYFEPFDTPKKFQNYDGVVSFQGIFEETEVHTPPYSSSYITIKCYRDELQRRKKQYQLLMEKKSFSCFLFIAPLIARDEHGDKSGTDLIKWLLNYPSFYRKNLGTQTTSLRMVRNEFIYFLEQFGAAWTTFSYYGDVLELKEICKHRMDATGIILWNRQYFVPTLKP